MQLMDSLADLNQLNLNLIKDMEAICASLKEVIRLLNCL